MTTAIDSLEIEGYKCFERLRVPLAPLTLLSGFNGAGKSTALQPLLLLAQAARLRIWGADGLDGDLPLNGEVVRLGSAGDVLRTGSGTLETRFSVSVGESTLEISVRAKAGERVLHTSCDCAPPHSTQIVDRLSRRRKSSAIVESDLGECRGRPAPNVSLVANSDGSRPFGKPQLRCVLGVRITVPGA
jgi:hypothetical protein